MKSEFEKRFFFRPEYHPNGKFLYEGQPCPTIRVRRYLGKKGVEFLDKKIKEMIAARVEMFGARFDNSHGLPSELTFLDKTKKAIIQVLELGCEKNQSYHSEKFSNKEMLFNPALFKKENYHISLTLGIDPVDYLESAQWHFDNFSIETKNKRKE